MNAIRDIKRKARRDLHKAMQVSAIYIKPNGEAVEQPIHVRIHTKWDNTTLDGGTRNGTMVSRQSIFPKILFMRDELAALGVVLAKKGIVSIEPGEAYELDNSEPPDDISVSWFVNQMKESDAEGLPVPNAQ